MKFYLVKGDRGGWWNEEFSYVVKNFSTVRKIFDKEISTWLNKSNMSWEDCRDDDPVDTYDEWLDGIVNDYREFGDLVYWEEMEFADEKFE